MTQFLPQNLLALFAPRDPIPYVPPSDKLPHEKPNTHNYAGVGAFLHEFEDPKDTPPPTRVETKDERKERKRKERAEQVAYKLEQDLALWAPTEDPAIIGDPFKTLFVARVNYDSSESKMRREFEVYGPVKQISIVFDRAGKPRGYAFIEYEHERDMHSAYKHADGKKIDGRRVLVDVERGRTVKGWRPRRLGGGLGGTRRGGPEMNSKYSGREDNHNRDRSRSRSRGERDSRETRPRRGRSRSVSKSRERPPRRPRRSRSRERKRRSRSRDRGGDRGKDREQEERPKRRRSRSKDRSDRSKRSRSRDRKRRRSRSRDRKSRRDRDRGNGEEILNPDDIKQEKISGKTPPHEHDDNGYQLPEGTYNSVEEGGAAGEYGDVNGEKQLAPTDQQATADPPQFDTNEYGSAE